VSAIALAVVVVAAAIALGEYHVRMEVRLQMMREK
jgi:hypothetical protein